MADQDTSTQPRAAHPRLMLIATAAGAGLIAAVASGMTVVYASATGCTFAPDGDTCMSVHGSGLHVDSVRVNRNRTQNVMICDYHATVTVSGVSGVWRSGTHEGCSPYQAWMDVAIGRDFADHSQICGRFFEGNVQQGGSVCETIHR